ncbi:hypothetical protein AB0469_15090 [Streptomyces sp. NPDC093801]|uniref:hypothetical protein n=1 Tax=Streptomyces sp. NPDC093801 TaxID=3155203 RepID=UPI00344F23D0
MPHRLAPGREELLAPAAIREFSDDLRPTDVEPLQELPAARLGEIARPGDGAGFVLWRSMRADLPITGLPTPCRQVREDLAAGVR